MLFVSQAKIYIDPNSLFQNEVEDVNIRVKTVISIVSEFKYELAFDPFREQVICQAPPFRNLFEQHKGNIKKYFKEEEPVEWQISPAMIFERVDAFGRRLVVLQVFNQSIAC